MKNPFNLDLKNKNVAEKLELGANHTAAMTGNARYPDAKRVPTDAEVAAAQSALSSANSAADAAETDWKELLRVRNTAEKVWDTVITARAGNCVAVTPGDAAAFASTALPLAGTGGAAIATPPQNFSLTQGDHSGEADGHCDRLKDATMYRTQWAASAAGPWTTGYEGTRSRFTIGGLAPGEEVWFRMAAFSGGAWTDWSAVVSLRII